MAKAKLGSGGRFKAGVKKIMAGGLSKKSAGAIMANAGRKKYGKTRFQKMAATGRRRKMG